MKICFVSNLNINNNINALKQDIYEWALKDAKKKSTDVVIFLNGFCENISPKTSKYVFDKVSSLKVKTIFSCDNSPGKTYKNIINSGKNANKYCYTFGKYSVIVLNCKNGEISENEYEAFDCCAMRNAVTVLNSPVDTLNEKHKNKLLDVLTKSPKMQLFSPEGDFVEGIENVHYLKSSNPDKLSNDHPLITYYDTEENKIEYSYYYCPLPCDFNEYIGISCKDILNDIVLATKHNLSFLELPESVIDYDKKEVLSKLDLWRQSGGKCLSLNVAEIYKTNWDKLIEEVIALGINRVNIVLPEMEKEGSEEFLKDLAEKTNNLPENCEVSLENAKTEKTYDDVAWWFDSVAEHFCNKTSQRVNISFNLKNAGDSLSEWCSVLCDKCVSYRMSFEKCEQLTDLFNKDFSYAPFFKEWARGNVSAGAVILDLKNTNEYENALNFFAEEKNKNVFDLHSHTYYSACGRDKMEELIEGAVLAGVRLLGITDHNYGIGKRKEKYFTDVKTVAQKYKDKIKILCGIEISVLQKRYDIRSAKDIENYDYCLIEHLDLPGNIVGDDLFNFCKGLGIRCGIAHTDLFKYCDVFGFEYKDFFRKMAENGIFWEMNVNYDSIHEYKHHKYVDDFINSEEKREIIRNAGVYVSVGFDSHRIEDYDGYRVRKMYDFLKSADIKTADLLF